MTTRVFKNEEDLKIKFVVQYLGSLGFDMSELSFEESFEFTLGTYVFRVETSEQIRHASPRLDILVRRDGANLCILEIKADSHKLEDRDIRQATSYASAIRPMAPFCIITNGRSARFVDTITGGDIDLETIRTSEGYIPSFPEPQVYEALKHFIGYSKDNLIAFCRQQVLSGMEQLLGSADEPLRKYIPDLYVEPVAIEGAFSAFLGSEARAFAVTAESGRGKTCWMCHASLACLFAGQPTIFHRAQNVASGLFARLASDLSWELSPSFSEAQAAKRFFEALGDEEVLFFIDGLDEIDEDDARRLTRDALLHMRGRKARLVVSCKSNRWQSMLEHDDVPTELRDALSTKSGPTSFALAAFTKPEFYHVLEKYRDFYRRSVRMDRELQEDCQRDPFLLAVLFQNMGDSDDGEHGTSYVALFERYHSRLLNRFRTDEREGVDRLLCLVARLLFEGDTDSMPLDTIRNHAGLSLTESIPERLFDLSILDRDVKDNITALSFYHKRYRDYLIVHKITGWERMSDVAFSESLDGLSLVDAQVEALALYYARAPENHRRVIDRESYEYALGLLIEYKALLTESFPALRRWLPPYRASAIGIVGIINVKTRRVEEFTYRSIGEGDSDVQFIPKTEGPWDHQLSRYYNLSGSTPIQGIDPERFPDARDAVVDMLIRQLASLVSLGLLDETGSETLTAELLVAASYKYYPGAIGAGLLSGVRRLSVDAMREAVLQKRAYERLEGEHIEAKLRSGTIQREWSPEGYASYPVAVSEAEKQQLVARAREVAQRGELIEPLYREYENSVDLIVLGRLARLKDRGIGSISWRTTLDRPEEMSDLDAIAALAALVPYRAVPLQETLALVVRLIAAGLKAYRALLESSFESIKECFPLYAAMPVCCLVELTGQPMDGRQGSPSVITRYARHIDLVENEVIGIESHQYTESASRWELTYGGRTYEPFEERTDHLATLTRPGGGLSAPHKAPFTSFDLRPEDCLVRSYAYSRIRTEFADAMKCAFEKEVSHHELFRDDS